MTKRERRSRPGHPSGRWSLDALLDGSRPPGRDPLAAQDYLAGHDRVPDDDLARWRPVAQVLTALTSAPESSELAGEARALAEFRARPDPAEPASTHYRPDPAGLTWLRRGRPAVAAATAGLTLVAGLLAVAYAGDLPAAAQQLAHDAIDAPAAGPRAARGPDPVTSPHPAGQRHGQARAPAGQRTIPGGQQHDHREQHGARSGSRHQNHRQRPGSVPARAGGGWPSTGSPSSGSPRATPHGGPAQSPSPDVSATPGPTQQPSPSASTAPATKGSPSPPP